MLKFTSCLTWDRPHESKRTDSLSKAMSVQYDLRKYYAAVYRDLELLDIGFLSGGEMFISLNMISNYVLVCA